MTNGRRCQISTEKQRSHPEPSPEELIAVMANDHPADITPKHVARALNVVSLREPATAKIKVCLFARWGEMKLPGGCWELGGGWGGGAGGCEGRVFGVRKGWGVWFIRSVS